MQLLLESNLNSIHIGHMYQSNSTESLLAMSVETLLCKAAVNHMINRSPTLFTGQAFSLSLCFFFTPLLSFPTKMDLIWFLIRFSIQSMGTEFLAQLLQLKRAHKERFDLLIRN